MSKYPGHFELLDADRLPQGMLLAFRVESVLAIQKTGNAYLWTTSRFMAWRTATVAAKLSERGFYGKG